MFSANIHYEKINIYILFLWYQCTFNSRLKWNLLIDTFTISKIMCSSKYYMFSIRFVLKSLNLNQKSFVLIICRLSTGWFGSCHFFFTRQELNISFHNFINGIKFLHRDIFLNQKKWNWSYICFVLICDWNVHFYYMVNIFTTQIEKEFSTSLTFA